MAIAVRLAALACAGVWLGVLAILVTTPATAPPAEAAGRNAAAVVVDDGSGPRNFCVLFSGDSISGVEALQATKLPVTTRAFGANGAAVCAVGGTGCGSGTDCLTCKAPDYWGYSRASVGATGFTYSMAGASSTRVTNGSVEGWQWGTGGSPAFASFAKICADALAGGGSGGGGGGAVASTAPAGSGGAATGGGGGAGSTGSGTAAATGGGGGGASGADPADAPVTSIDPVTGEVVAVDPAAAGDTGAAAVDPGSQAAGPAAARATVVDADALAAPAADDDPTAGSPWAVLGWVVFAAIVVGVVVAVAVLRVRRGHT